MKKLLFGILVVSIGICISLFIENHNNLQQKVNDLPDYGSTYIFSDDETYQFSSKKIAEMSSEEYIEIFKTHRVIYFFPGDIVENWPSKSDVPYLIEMLDSQEVCGVRNSLTAAWGPTREQSKQPCAIVALYLLEAIKKAHLDLRWQHSFTKGEVQELKKWATKQLLENKN